MTVKYASWYFWANCFLSLFGGCGDLTIQHLSLLPIQGGRGSLIPSIALYGRIAMHNDRQGIIGGDGF